MMLTATPLGILSFPSPAGSSPAVGSAAAQGLPTLPVASPPPLPPPEALEEEEEAVEVVEPVDDEVAGGPVPIDGEPSLAATA